QAALGLGQFGIRSACLRLLALAAACAHKQRDAHAGHYAETFHRTPPTSGPRNPIQADAQLNSATTTDRTSPSGMTAHASFACWKALISPSSQVTASSSTYQTGCPAFLSAVARLTSANSSASPQKSKAPAVSQEAKLLHWI